jgi:S-adenosylmethionine hydrolase
MRGLTIAALVLATAAHAAGPPTVVFLSDFGTRDDAVAICKGVMLQVEPALRMIDLTHQVTPFAIADAARLLADTADHYPAGTVFLAVIDPGVGTERKAMIARSKRGQFFVLPDNGLVTLVADRQGLAGAREIVNPRWMRVRRRARHVPRPRHLRAGRGAPRARRRTGRRRARRSQTPVRLDIRAAPARRRRIRGTVIATDGPYGNLLTDVDATLFHEARLGARRHGARRDRRCEAATLPFARTFRDVAEGKPCSTSTRARGMGVGGEHGELRERPTSRPRADVDHRRK